MKIAICNVQEFNPTIGGIERVSVSRADFDAVAMAERVPTQSRHHDAGG